MMRTQFIKAALVSSMALIGAVSTDAQATVTYDYVGNSFTSVETSSFGTSLDASVTFDNTVTSNFTGYVSAYDIVAFTLYGVGSGISVASSSSYTITNDFTFTDGKITAWNIGAVTPLNGGIYAGTENYLYYSYSYVEDTVNTYGNNFNGQNYNLGPAGTWTEVSAVPLPAALPMFGAAVAGLAALAKRRRIIA